MASSRLAKLVLLAAILYVSCADPSKSGEEDHATNNVSHQLVIDLLREDRVDGSYWSPQLGCGIVFNSTRDSLIVSTLNGSRLMSAEEQVGPIRLVTLGNREFIQHREVDPENEESGTVQDYAIPKYHGSFAGTQNHDTFADLLDKLKKLDRNTHARVLQKSLKRILTEPEIELLHDAAIAMGQQGITGQEYPSTLPIYMTAMRLGSHPTMTTSAAAAHLHRTDSGFLHTRIKRSRQICLKKCPPCKDMECLGMCGRGCSCWDWACGNCCYHKGCYYHDLCCRSRPDSLACWLPLEFECDKKYICKDPF